MKIELFSWGAHSQILRVPHDNAWSGRAQLAKEALAESPEFPPILLYYQFAVARVMMPQNFPVVSGASVGDGVTGKLYSRIADVPPQHAWFVSHIDIDEGLKTRCECGECVDHWHFHENEIGQWGSVLEARAIKDATGIGVPYSDPSDYCLNPHTGDIVFFEIEEFNVGAIKRRLPHYPETTAERVERLLDRYLTVGRNMGFDMRELWGE